ncbi:hypothetical protein ABIF96_008002 [Bradyrhizobium ottawaense]
MALPFSHLSDTANAHRYLQNSVFLPDEFVVLQGSN